ncbi:uncharacterized protein [Prorops nasuta]|uniref:uncharacterized protein n=1 Tax=Prorops nasuta TaxID=863751 RepID=UPI0034CFA4B3
MEENLSIKAGNIQLKELRIILQDINRSKKEEQNVSEKSDAYKSTTKTNILTEIQCNKLVDPIDTNTKSKPLIRHCIKNMRLNIKIIKDEECQNSNHNKTEKTKKEERNFHNRIKKNTILKQVEKNKKTKKADDVFVKTKSITRHCDKKLKLNRNVIMNADKQKNNIDKSEKYSDKFGEKSLMEQGVMNVSNSSYQKKCFEIEDKFTSEVSKIRNLTINQNFNTDDISQASFADMNNNTSVMLNLPVIDVIDMNSTGFSNQRENYFEEENDINASQFKKKEIEHSVLLDSINNNSITFEGNKSLFINNIEIDQSNNDIIAFEANEFFTNNTEPSKLFTEIAETKDRNLPDTTECYNSETNDSDYNPNNDSESSESYEEDESEQVLNTSKRSKNISKDSTDLEVSINTPATSACNDENMFVVPRASHIVKKNCCLYCKQLQSKIARHLEMKHSDEADVKKFSLLPKGCRERKLIIDTIRRKGNFLHNTDYNLNKGELIVCRRPNEKRKKNATDYLACSNCKGFFSKLTIRHHFDHCVAKKKRKQSRSVMILGRAITARIHEAASDILKRVVFPVMREDQYTRLIRYDKLIILYANKLCIKYRPQHQHDLIRARLRLLARFLTVLKEDNKEITDFASLYNPKYYDNCISAINTLGKLDSENNVYKVPSVPFNMGTYLKQIGSLYIAECIKNGDGKCKETVEDFLKLLLDDYSVSVNKTVEETRAQNKRHKKIVLPSMNDIAKLHNHLRNIRVKALKYLQEKFSYSCWISLGEATLISLQIFNRRRAGEIERVLIQDYNNYNTIDENTDGMYNKLTPEGKEKAKSYTRFEIRGKKNRIVSVLLHKQLHECVKMLLKYRSIAGVHEKNPFLFGIPGYVRKRFKHLKACNLLRKFANECHAEIPYSLRGTELRKHVATKCVELELNENEVMDVAKFLGHEDKIHRQHYRQSIVSREITKMSRLLEIAQGVAEESDNSESEEECNVKNNKDLSLGTSDLSNTEIYSNDDSFKVDNNRKRKKKRSTSPFGPTKRRRWTTEEKDELFKEFGHYIEQQTFPSLQEISKVISSTNSTLRNRTAPQVKTWMSNLYKKESNS